MQAFEAHDEAARLLRQAGSMYSGLSFAERLALAAQWTELANAIARSRK